MANDMLSNIKVAVRLRPMNQTELRSGDVSCLQILKDKQTLQASGRA